MPFLRCDIVSVRDNVVYGNAGSEVALVSDHGEVAIVELQGNRFAVKFDELATRPEQAVKVKPAAVIEQETKPVKKSKAKSKPHATKGLF